MIFILCHEFAHIELEHFKKLNQAPYNSSQILEFEKEADLRSMDLVLKKINKQNKISAELGILMGLCSMLFFTQNSKSTTHPAIDDRIHKLIEKVNPSNTDAHYGIAVLAFQLWDKNFNKNFIWPKRVNDLKELYDLIRLQIQNENN
jgi:hypothetical protein